MYLLHGLGDNHTGWIQFGQVQYIADKAIAEGKSAPMIIVMPDADTVHKGYFNLLDGTYNYEDFFFKELIPHIEKVVTVLSPACRWEVVERCFMRFIIRRCSLLLLR